MTIHDGSHKRLTACERIREARAQEEERLEALAHIFGREACTNPLFSQWMLRLRKEDAAA